MEDNIEDFSDALLLNRVLSGKAKENIKKFDAKVAELNEIYSEFHRLSKKEKDLAKKLAATKIKLEEYHNYIYEGKWKSNE